MHCIKIDPSCLISNKSLELLVSNITQHPNADIYISTTQNTITKIPTVLHCALNQDSHAYTILRTIVLEYRTIFHTLENIHTKTETFYQDIESLIKFVEISGEYTPNLLNIILERFCRLTLNFVSQYTGNKFKLLQYHTKHGITDISFADGTTVTLLKHKKHIYNIEKKYIKNPKIVKAVSFQDFIESPSFGFKGLTIKEITALQHRQSSVNIVEIESGIVETQILPTATSEDDIKFATCKEDISVITLQHAKGLQTSEILNEITRFINGNNIEMLFASQPSTNSSVSFGIETTHSDAIQQYLNERFIIELANGTVAYFCLHNQSMISVIGNGMAGKTGTAGRLFSHLGKEKINISTIVQNASEVSISFTVDGTKTQAVMNEINKICFHKQKHISLLLFGYGNIAKGLVKMLEKQKSYFAQQHISISINLIANSKEFVIDENAQNTSLCNAFGKSKIEYSNLHDIQKEIEIRDLLNPILIDLTSSEELAKSYPWFIQKKMHIVSASKKANSLPYKEYKNIHNLCAENGVHFLYEANVGAGLPIVATIQDMLHSGDALLKCEGVFSGTLSYIFNKYDGKIPFSQVVKQAQEQGFTEPDPRDDLCGADAARKLLIIARMFGYELNYEDITVESLVPQELSGGKYEASFFEQYSQYDGKMAQMLEEARQKNKVLRYVCLLENGKAYAKIMSVPINSPLGSIQETDNIIAFTTNYYSKTPIVIQGAGAGIDVTSMAVLSDIIKVFKYTQV